MKKVLPLFLFFLPFYIFSQADYSGVMNLLLANKREEARKSFDKQFAKTKSSNLNLLFLDAILDQEMGQIDYDETFLKQIQNLPNSEYFVSIFINENFILGDIPKNEINSLSYQKVDFLASVPKFMKVPVVRYRKAVLDKKRHRYQQADELFKSLGTITQWQFCGVFENLNGSGLDIEYEPESHPKADKLFDANSNGKVGWYNPKNVQVDAYNTFENEAQYGSGIIYAQTFVTSPEPKECLLSFGSNSGVKIFLNDKEIYMNADIKYTNLDAYAIKINLEKGYNRLLFKIELGSADYFSARINELDNTLAKDLTFSPLYQDYPQRSGLADVPAIEVKSDYENYFDNLVKQNPDNVLYRLYQFMAYQCNSKRIEAFQAIEGLDKKYPNSSLIANYFMKYYNLLPDGAEKTNEVTKNLENNDPNYYYTTYLKLTDSDWLVNCPIQELEKYRDKAQNFKQPFAKEMYEFMIISRKADIDGLISKLDDLMRNNHPSEKLQVLAATFPDKLKNDRAKTISQLESLVGQSDNYEADNLLLNYYNEMGKKEEVQAIIRKRIQNYPYLNQLRNDLAQVLINENQYEQALKVVDENLANFPYSFDDLERKANIYSLMKNDKAAESCIRQSLLHNSGNSGLRKKLYDLNKTPDEIEVIATKDLYSLIKERRKSKLESNYGVAILLDEYIVNVLPEGGRRSKAVTIYEITGEKGIEEMKEYSLDSNYNNILKSEIVKPDGSLVPAEIGNGILVFANLKVGDVIYIESERYNNATGRFYKDFNIASYFSTYYPSLESTFALICPNDIHYEAAFINGNITPTVKKINNKTCTVWKKKNIPAVENPEKYSPIFNDFTNAIYVGTIKSWSDISNWYTDLVKKSLKLDKTTKDTFDSIFPEGVAGLSQEKIARRIYAYIEDNITYSSLDFRQSGYVPQKPSKTITTKLGDCKDVSTLFVALSQLAGLKSNLVLVSTTSRGLKTMPLPSSDFNHCIVKVSIDGQDRYLELTDKYMPFGALPNSLYRAKALVISFDKNEKLSPVSITFDKVIPSMISTQTIADVDDKGVKFTYRQKIQGANKSYYNELLSAATSEEVRKDELVKDYNSKLNEVVNLQSVKLIENDPYEKDLTFETQFSISKKPKSIGSLQILEIPFIEKIYNRDVISEESRHYEIQYPKYESTNEYHTEIILNLPESKQFTEIPENKTFAYLGHRYEIRFDLVKPHVLKIIRNGIVSWDDILPAEYPAFKKYVEEVIEAEERIIGYK